MYLIVGCGLSGAVIAERITNILAEPVLIIEKSNHIAGNCYDYIDEDTGIRCSKYGAHLFHTNNENVWKYINSFCKWIRWDHKVLSFVDGRCVSVPINITTVNELCNQNIKDSNEMHKWLDDNQVKYHGINEIVDSEQIALSRVGKELYEKMIKEYTYKQWAKYPKELDKSVLERIPVRDNHDTRYFNDKYQVLPEKGYTDFVMNMLNNPLITYKLNTDFFEFKKNNDMSIYKKIIYTGAIDRYFEGLEDFEKLEYRSIEFVKEVYKNMRYYQQNSVVNYPEKEYNFTRIVEYKHFLNQTSEDTIIFKEITNDNGDPYYPVPTKRNKELYEKYKKLADKEENVIFVGRLANYKYFNMDEAISNALDIFEKQIKNDY